MRDLLRLATFRLSLIAVPLNVAAGLLVLAFIYVNTASIMESRVDQGITAERQRLLANPLPREPAALREAIRRRIAAERGSARLYLLRASDGGVLEANFRTSLRADLPRPGEFTHATVERLPEGSAVEARLHAFPLAHQVVLVIGRDLAEQSVFRVVIEESLAIAILATVLLGTGAGVVTSRAVLRRLAKVNATARGILRGCLDERVPLAGTADEFDHLADNVNAMLDRIGELMQATREVTDNVAHDLRGPLNRMRGRLELALLPGVPRDELEGAVRAALDEADGLLGTFEALLTIARLEHGVVPDFAAVDLARLCEDVVDYFAPLAEETGLALTLGEAAPLVVSGNRHLLFQALSNIVDNALRYTPAGGHVAVEVGRDGQSAVVAVADDGPGIAADKRDQVRRRFARLDASRHQPGTGLGLSVVEAVARHHRARLELADNRPGLRVTLRLPLPPGHES